MPTPRRPNPGSPRPQRDQERAVVVEPFIAATGERVDGRPAMTLRDTIRAYGPTVRFATDPAR